MDDYIRLIVDKELKDKAKKFAKESGINLSALIRMLLIKEMLKNLED